MADFGDGLSSLGGISGGGGGGGNAFAGTHLTYSAQLFEETLRRGEVQTWEGDEDDVVRAFLGIRTGMPTDRTRYIAEGGEWGRPYVAGVQAPRRNGGTWNMQVTVAQLRKAVMWTLEFAEVQKDIRTWLQNQDASDGEQDGDAIPDLTKIAQWERAKDVQDWDNYDAFKTVDGNALADNTLELAKMIKKGIESYTIHTPIPTMTFRYFDGVTGTGKLLDKYLEALPTGPVGYAEIGAQSMVDQLDELKLHHTDGSGGVGTIGYMWLCVTDKSTPNGDGSHTRVVQFMRVDEVETRLYSRGSAQDGGFA